MNLSDVLQHSALLPAEPIVRAAFDAVPGRQVRWIHSSEMLDIGPLLRGGELLLSGGTALAAEPVATRRRYIADLAARHVAALAVETGERLPQLPADLVRAAEAHQLPLIELRRVVPFVEVAESINSVLVSDSVSRLRRADELSHTLAVELAAGAGLRQLLEVISGELGARVSLLMPGRSFSDLINIDMARISPVEPVEVVEVDIALQGMVVADMKIALPPGSDVEMVRIAGRRVADVLALALLQRRPPSLDNIAGAELIRAVTADEPQQVLVDLCAPAAFDARAPVIMLVARTQDSNQLRGVLERIVTKHTRRAVGYAKQNEVIVLVELPTAGSRQSRVRLLGLLRREVGELAAAICVGPTVDSIHGGAYSLAQARLTLHLAASSAWRAEVLDSDDFIIDRMIAENLGVDAKARLVAELLGELLGHDAKHGTSLTATLEAWLQNGCNTAQTARLLHLERQSLHNRLQRIFDLVGGDPRGTGRLAGLQMALRVERQPASKYPVTSFVPRDDRSPGHSGSK